MSHTTDSWRTAMGPWVISVEVARRPLSLTEAKDLLRDLKEEIARAERNDDDPGEA